jgi:hypothetical protein
VETNEEDCGAGYSPRDLFGRPRGFGMAGGVGEKERKGCNFCNDGTGKSLLILFG